MHLRLSTLSLLLLLACKPADGGNGETGTSSDGGDESLGMGATSATLSDPSVATFPTSTAPTDPTVTTVTATSATQTSADPTVPTTITSVTDATDPGTESSATDGTLSDATTSPATSSDDATSSTPCPNPGDLPQGGSCNDASGCECASGRCFLVPILGGFCSECLGDGDCPNGGCTVPNPIQSIGAVCNDGEPGAGCMSDAACNDPANTHCGVILDIVGILTVATCGECITDTDCPQVVPHCTPVIDLSKFSGVRQCRPGASLPNNASCEFEPDPMGEPLGNAACMSGFCGAANVMGLLQLGICGECNSNADCPQGQTCTDPIVDLDAEQLIGSFCQ